MALTDHTENNMLAAILNLNPQVYTFFYNNPLANTANASLKITCNEHHLLK